MTVRDPNDFATDLDALEEVERATARLVSEGVHLVLDVAASEFRAIDPTSTDVADAANYLGEDLTRSALDGIGTATVPGARIFGAIDYKRAVFQFLPEFSVRQALLVDSKAEKNAFNNLRVQITQTSLAVRQSLSSDDVDVSGRVPRVYSARRLPLPNDYLFREVPLQRGEDGRARAPPGQRCHIAERLLAESL